MNNMYKQKLWGEFKQWIRFFPLAIFSFFVVFCLLTYGMAFAYDPIVKLNPELEKIIIMSGVYVYGWTAFHMLFFFEHIKFLKKSNKEFWGMAYRSVRRILSMPIVMYGMTFLFAWFMNNAKKHHSEDLTIMIGVYIWFYVFFKLSGEIMNKNEKDK